MEQVPEPPLTVRQTLLLPSLSTARVVAGDSGLEREVTSAMVLEAPDIENWGRRGQLILTSFFALQDLSPSELERFFEKLSQIGISGLIFKVTRLVDELPKTFLGLCDHYALPLIKISGATKYEPILLDVMGHVINTNVTLLNRFFDVHEQTMALSLKQPSKYEILMSLRSFINAESTVLDVSQKRRVSSSGAQRQGDFLSFDLEELEGNRYQTHTYYHARLTYEDHGSDALAVLIPSSDSCVYYLFVYRTTWQLSALDIMAIESVVNLLQIEILKKNAIDQEIFIQNNNVVHDLLLGRFTSHEKIDAALVKLSLDTKPLYQVLLVRIDLTDQQSPIHQNDVRRAVQKGLKAIYPGLAFFSSNDRLVFLHNFRTKRGQLSLEKIQSVLRDLHTDRSIPSFTHFAALSHSCDRYSIVQRNEEVLGIYKLLDNARWTNRCISYENLGIYKLFLQVDGSDNLTSYVDPRILKLRERSPELLETLVALVENGLSYQKAAKLLFLHPKTVHYRIERAKQLVGLDVLDADDCLQLMLSSKIFNLMSDQT